MQTSPAEAADAASLPPLVGVASSPAQAVGRRRLVVGVVPSRRPHATSSPPRLQRPPPPSPCRGRSRGETKSRGERGGGRERESRGRDTVKNEDDRWGMLSFLPHQHEWTGSNCHNK
uniref:Uncharacterized protein n=1 Tax=Oryza sativa subsp. japonica TaxID=39947 RepID=Q7XIV9_ORYSJ|nr:hypothetical protein [Oryza sativa Japonica Group]